MQRSFNTWYHLGVQIETMARVISHLSYAEVIVSQRHCLGCILKFVLWVPVDPFRTKTLLKMKEVEREKVVTYRKQKRFEPSKR